MYANHSVLPKWSGVYQTLAGQDVTSTRCIHWLRECTSRFGCEWKINSSRRWPRSSMLIRCVGWAFIGEQIRRTNTSLFLITGLVASEGVETEWKHPTFGKWTSAHNA